MECTGAQERIRTPASVSMSLAKIVSVVLTIESTSTTEASLCQADCYSTYANVAWATKCGNDNYSCHDCRECFQEATTATPSTTAATSSCHALAGGRQHTVIVKSDGSVYTAGYNIFSQLGDGTRIDRHSFVQVVTHGGIASAAGNSHTVILKNDGSVHTAGDNSYGQRGGATSIDSMFSFMQVLPNGVSIIAAGHHHTVVLKQNGSVHTVGSNCCGQLADGTTFDKHSFVEVVSNGASAIAAGFEHTALLMKDGSVHVAGCNELGQLGDGGGNSEVHSFMRVVPNGVSAIAAGALHTVLLNNDGSVHTAGSNNCGQLGDGTAQDKYVFVRVVAHGVSAIAAGGSHTLILMHDGSLHSSGSNTYGQLGDGGSNSELYSFVQVVPHGVVAIAAGRLHTIILDSTGSVHAAGRNRCGQLADGTTIDKYSFVQVVGTGVSAQCHFIETGLIMTKTPAIVSTITNSTSTSMTTTQTTTIVSTITNSTSTSMTTTQASNMQVVFAPFNAGVVGVFDPSTSIFSNVSTGSLTMGLKFSGAAAVGTQVVFAPYVADVVGVFDTSTSSFSASVSTGSLTGYGKFNGAVAMTKANTSTMDVTTSTIEVATSTEETTTEEITTSITTTVATSTITTSTYIAETVIKYSGSLQFTVNNLPQFLQEPNIINVLKIAIAQLCEVDVSYVYDVNISITNDTRVVGNRLLQEDGRGNFDGLEVSRGGVKVIFVLVVPPHGKEEYRAIVIADTFNEKTFAISEAIIENVLESSFLSQTYDLKVTSKEIRREYLHSASPPSSASVETDSPVEIIVLVCSIVSTAVIVAVLTWYLSCHLRRKRAFRESTALRSSQTLGIPSRDMKREDGAFMEAAGPMGECTLVELLSPPHAISKGRHRQLLQLISSLMCIDRCAVDAFILYAVGHRDADAVDSGPGLYSAAALLKVFHMKGLNCILPLPGVLRRDDFLKMLRTQGASGKTLLVLESADLFNCGRCLEALFVAQKHEFDFKRIRMDDTRDCSESRWPHVGEGDYEAVKMIRTLESGYFLLPTYPEGKLPVLLDPQQLVTVAVEITASLRLNTSESFPSADDASYGKWNSELKRSSSNGETLDKHQSVESILSTSPSWKTRSDAGNRNGRRTCLQNKSSDPNAAKQRTDSGSEPTLAKAKKKKTRVMGAMHLPIGSTRSAMVGMDSIPHAEKDGKPRRFEEADSTSSRKSRTKRSRV